MNITVDELNEAIKNALDDYNEKVVTELKKTTKKAMTELVKTTKATAPVGRREKHYRDNITSKTLEETAYGVSRLWYVKGSDYRLTHLLEHGHALRNGGRYEGTQFIGNALDSLIPEYVKRIEEICKNG